jgi:hypothetical protein
MLQRESRGEGAAKGFASLSPPGSRAGEFGNGRQTPSGTLLENSNIGYELQKRLFRDSAGNVYVAGETLSTDFPLVNAYQSTTKTPGYTAFVSALNSTGTALLYSTYLGGSVSNGGNPGSDIASSIAWDSFDNAVYVVGTATNSDFPTTPGAFQTKNPNGQYFPFVARLSHHKSNRLSWLEGWSKEDGASALEITCKMGVFSKSVMLRICRSL